ncbi:glycoprotein-N-acetylgalactosamine 3-beta-galactosyltransferase 1-like [Teleopsis dalmanni]|uniref:glycoprotein-N-acetylgalactosamine 3-beta-galactosyltransferase 1-like n=1 Tax=Teleopsis dalmanni TaxID=139649 RepID=UPI0018CDEE63|nr:glycoprotein-N-acetylgalactosamine 3-beta-galactosyltransferase 1-like [Teleopsis dalmanni]XP_037932990.1 glycoprotein-N-acetylgalactosamine 3-beta-galactosyltransferase 1-like [Teleopsis dalmanni]
MIMTTGYRHNLEAARIYRTWTQRCDKTLFMSDDFHDEIQPVIISKNEEWGKLKESLTFVYNYHYHNADWFLRAADDNFVILENLRYLLYPYSNKTPIYFGYKLKNKDGEAYMSSSAGYVLSKEALRRFVKSALPNTEICTPGANGKESEELARCLKNVGVLAGDSRAEDGSNTFFPFSLSDYLKGLKPEDHKFLYENSFYAMRNKSFPLSKKMISFSNVHRDDLYTLEYFIYNMRVFGQKRLPAQLPIIENPVEIK